MAVQFDISGDKELMRALESLEKKTYVRSVLNATFRKAMKPILKKARENARAIKNAESNTPFKKASDLARFTVIRTSRSRKYAGAVWVGPNYSKMPNAAWWEAGTKERYSGGAYRGRIKPVWYLYRAYKSGEREATNIAKDLLIKEIEKKKAKLGMR